MPKGTPKSRNKANDRTDAIAREAARLLARREAADMSEALRLANDGINGNRHRPPSPGRVRQHAQAMSMQAMGEAAYRKQHARWLAIAEEVMTTIELALPDSSALLVGRAAEAGDGGKGGKGWAGHFDADPTIHIRVYATDSITEIAHALGPFGYDDPETKFTTMDGRHGRLSQMQWMDEGVRIVLTRCPQRFMFDDQSDLVTGKAVARMTLRQLRQSIAQ
jgi:hypothetical protein